MIMGAEKSWDLWSENWRHKNTNGMIQSESKAWEPGEPMA